jgi:ATP-dependent Lhr-like helicase
MCRQRPLTLAIAVNDYGMELLSPDPVPWDELLTTAIWSEDALLDDILASVNATELARRRFRDVARVAGFVNLGPVHKRNTGRQVQASSSLLFDVFLRYDNENPLLAQARREVLEIHFDERRLRDTLRRITMCHVVRRTTDGPTPLSMPLIADRLQGDKASSHTDAQRLRRAVEAEAPRLPPGSPGSTPRGRRAARPRR